VDRVGESGLYSAEFACDNSCKECGYKGAEEVGGVVGSDRLGREGLVADFGERRPWLWVERAKKIMLGGCLGLIIT